MQTISPGHFIRPQTAPKRPQSVDALERINEDFKKAKKSKSGQSVMGAGPVPITIDGASLATSDLRHSLPVAESPLSPHLS